MSNYKLMYFLRRNENPRTNPRKNFTKAMLDVIDRDGTCCHYCGSSNATVFDHVVPRCNGGGNNAENLVLACFACNSSKGSKEYGEFMFIVEAEKIAYQMHLEAL